MPGASEDRMDKERMMPVKASQATMWTLNEDRKTVRLAVPPLRLAGMPEPLDVFMDFDTATVDAMLERLTVLRNEMLPPLPAPGKRRRDSAQGRPTRRAWAWLVTAS
jgi:hypothetical protein